MADEPLPSGWLPPRPPTRFPAPPAPGDTGARPPEERAARPAGSRDPRAWPPPPDDAGWRRTARPHRPPEPSSPVAVAGIAAGAASLVLLVLSAGLSFGFSIALSLVGFLLGRQVQRQLEAGAPGRPGQARAAVVLAAVGLGLAGAAAAMWMVLYANGITAQDLERALQRQAERLERR